MCSYLIRQSFQALSSLHGQSLETTLTVYLNQDLPHLYIYASYTKNSDRRHVNFFLRPTRVSILHLNLCLSIHQYKTSRIKSANPPPTPFPTFIPNFAPSEDPYPLFPDNNLGKSLIVHKSLILYINFIFKSHSDYSTIYMLTSFLNWKISLKK